ncbi:hypothetical protein V6N13_128463 [Hibiscus sabdariffa]|uniref:Uncharacterized protein n=1 Tax=Hibiscus sabdariffa TaxID=183260 RepID=A0ABR2P0T4_9ROSI
MKYQGFCDNKLENFHRNLLELGISCHLLHTEPALKMLAMGDKPRFVPANDHVWYYRKNIGLQSSKQINKRMKICSIRNMVRNLYVLDLVPGQMNK